MVQIALPLESKVLVQSVSNPPKAIEPSPAASPIASQATDEPTTKLSILSYTAFMLGATVVRPFHPAPYAASDTTTFGKSACPKTDGAPIRKKKSKPVFIELWSGRIVQPPQSPSPHW